MIKTILNILFLSLPLLGWGQLYTMSDHYVHSALAINPAYAGSQDALNATVLHRNYWKGFEGSPRTMALSAHAPFSSERLGLGMVVINDRIGVFNETSIIGNYAYRLHLDNSTLAFGLGFGAVFSNSNWSSLAAQDPDDNLLSNNTSTGLMPNFSIGTYYSTPNYFVGFSIPLFLSHKYDNTIDRYRIRNTPSAYNYFLNAGYSLDINNDIKLLPSFLIKYQSANVGQIDLNAQVIFRDMVWLGVTYRTRSTIVGMLQYQINDQLRLAYSYDFSLASTELFKHNNTHEIMINYVFNYNVEVAGPRNF